MSLATAVNVVALAVLVAIVLWWVRRPTEAVRLRNAWRLQPSRPEDFSWVPPHFPPGFVVERRQPGAEFREIVDSLGLDAIPGDWGKARALAGHLTELAEDKGPVRADPLTTYRAIRAGHGYCADFVKVFLVLAHAAGLVARQWAFSFDGFGGHGHTFVEVFDRERGKWLFLDVFNNFHVVDAASGEPLGALEFRDSLLGRRGIAEMRRNGSGRAGFIHDHKAIDYYLRGIHQWYLAWGNAAYSYYEHSAVRWAGRISRNLAHLAANLVGAQPHIRILATPENLAEVRSILRVRRVLWVTIVAIVVLTILLGVQFALSASGLSGPLAATPGMVAHHAFAPRSQSGNALSPALPSKVDGHDRSGAPIVWVASRA